MSKCVISYVNSVLKSCWQTDNYLSSHWRKGGRLYHQVCVSAGVDIGLGSHLLYTGESVPIVQTISTYLHNTEYKTIQLRVLLNLGLFIDITMDMAKVSGITEKEVEDIESQTQHKNQMNWCARIFHYVWHFSFLLIVLVTLAGAVYVSSPAQED